MGAFDLFNKKQLTEQAEAVEVLQKKLSEAESVLTAVSKVQAMSEPQRQRQRQRYCQARCQQR